MGDYERIRLVTLGGPGVGKSAIVKRFLFNTFSEKYKPTVEDLYNQEYDFGPITLKVDILDTAGELQFPAMRRLSIATAHAFLIVYTVESKSTFDLIKGFFEEIREQRADFQDIPIVVTGNKIDIKDEKKEVDPEAVSRWLEAKWSDLRVKSMECSAKEDINIKDVFRSFLNLSKLPIPNEDSSALKRRSSAHAGSKSPAPTTRSNSLATPTLSSSPTCSRQLTPTKGPPTSPSAHAYQQFLTEESALARSKPRSRSLIRRSSKKAKQQVRDASGGPGDCQTT